MPHTAGPLPVSRAKIAGDAAPLRIVSGEVGAVVPMPMLLPDCVMIELP